MNVNLGAPYESIIKEFIAKGYAGTQTEVIRQALRSYRREMEEEEAIIVGKAVEHEMKLIKSGKIKTLTYEEIKAKHKK